MHAATRRLGPRVALDRHGSVERWLCVSASEGERRLGTHEGMAAVRDAVARRSIQLGDIHAFVLRISFASALTRSRFEQWAAIEAAIGRGLVVVVEFPRALAQFEHDYLRTDIGAAPWLDEGPDPIVGPEKSVLIATPKATITLRCIEVGGHPVAGLPLQLEPGDGSVSEDETNSAGELRFDELRPGAYQVRIVTVADIDWIDDPEAERGLVPPGDDERTVDVAFDLSGPMSNLIEVETESRNCVILERPILRLLVPDFLRCDHDSVLLVPAPWTDDRHPLAGIVHAVTALLDAPERWLLVVGHASAPGSEARNQTLSEQRADGIRALIEGDGAAWVEHARDRGSLRDVAAYLDYLGRQRGWACGVETPVADLTTHATDETRAAVSAFQTEYNAQFQGTLAADGVCGNKTLAAIFEVLYDEFVRWLAKLGATPESLPLDRVVYTGYGSSLAGREGEGPQAEAADRLVDLILIDHLALAKDIEPAEVYASTIARRLPFKVPSEPDEWATGPLTIVSDLTPQEPAEPETYRLRSEDGSWSVERVLPDEGVVEHGELVLRFEALPTEHRYTLVVVASDGGESVIFADLAYGELHGASPDLS